MGDKPEGERVAADIHEPVLAVVGGRVRAARKRVKLSQTDLAKAIGSGQSYVFQIEAGEANITLKTLVRIAAAVGLSPRDLLPAEQPARIAEPLRAAMQDLERVRDRLFQVYGLLVADDPSTPAPGGPPGN